MLETITALARSGRLPHALIFEGNDSDEIISAAKTTAKAIFCSCDDFLSGECLSCRKISSDNHPDIITAETAGKQELVNVEEIRRLSAESIIKPIEAKSKVFILPGCDNMLPAAQNAFLKTFEEPPAGVYFIMLCRSSLNLLETIRSRGRIFSFKSSEVRENTSEASYAEDFCAALCAQGEGHALLALSAFCGRKNSGELRRLFSETLSEMREIFHTAMIISSGASPHKPKVSKAAERLAASFSSSQLLSKIRALDEISAGIKLNTSMGLLTAQTASLLQK